MNTFKLKVTSPEGGIFDGEAVCLSVRGAEGDLAVMAGHTQFITAVKPCECKIYLPDEKVRTGKTDGGMLTVGKEETVFLCGSFMENGGTDTDGTIL